MQDRQEIKVALFWQSVVYLFILLRLSGRYVVEQRVSERELIMKSWYHFVISTGIYFPILGRKENI